MILYPRFPGQGKVGGDSKIPSIIFYDRIGNVRAMGAEANEESFVEEAEARGYIGVEWYVYHTSRPLSSSRQ